MPNEKIREIRAIHDKLRGDKARLQAEIAAVRCRLEGLDIALTILQGKEPPPVVMTTPFEAANEPRPRRRRISNKFMVLQLLDEAGGKGLSVVEMLDRNPRFKRGTISSQLSHWNKDGIVFNAGGRYYLPKHPHPTITKTEPVAVLPTSGSILPRLTSGG